MNRMSLGTFLMWALQTQIPIPSWSLPFSTAGVQTAPVPIMNRATSLPLTFSAVEIVQVLLRIMFKMNSTPSWLAYARFSYWNNFLSSGVLSHLLRLYSLYLYLASFQRQKKLTSFNFGMSSINGRGEEGERK